MEKRTILAVEDTPSSLFLLTTQLEEAGYGVFSAEDGVEALRVLEDQPVDLILSDQEMPNMDGIELLKAVRKTSDLPFVILTGYGSIDKAVEALKEGADDYITRPYDIDELCIRIERAWKVRRLLREREELQAHACGIRGFSRIVTDAESMLSVIEDADKVARSPETPVLIYGESGVGKELLAHAIHCAAGRLESRFVGVNCAGIPHTLMESELFGYVKGAFTGADRDRAGKIDRAAEGTLLLDEIGDMPLNLQAKLLRVIEERTYERLGSHKPIPLTAQIIAATHRDLGRLVAEGRFREDLYYRINAYPLYMPALRERKGDVPILSDFFIDLFREKLGKAIPGISAAGRRHLESLDWPGNVRELKNCLERAVLLSDGELIRPGHLGNGAARPKTGGPAVSRVNGDIDIRMRFTRDEFSYETAVDRLLEEVLALCDDNKVKAAELLGMNRKVFYRRKNKQAG